MDVSELSLLDAVLVEVNFAMNCGERPSAVVMAERMKRPSNAIHQACWQLRKNSMLTEDNLLTDAGSARVKLIEENPAAAAINRGGRPRKTPAPQTPRKSAEPPTKARPDARAPDERDVIYYPPTQVALPEHRMLATRELATGLVDNIERAYRLHRALIGDQIEGMTEVLEASLDQLELAVQLLRKAGA